MGNGRSRQGRIKFLDLENGPPRPSELHRAGKLAIASIQRIVDTPKLLTDFGTKFNSIATIFKEAILFAP